MGKQLPVKVATNRQKEDGKERREKQDREGPPLKKKKLQEKNVDDVDSDVEDEDDDDDDESESESDDDNPSIGKLNSRIKSILLHPSPFF